MNFARLDLRFSDALSPIFFLVPSSNYDMSGREGRLVLRTDQGVELFNETGVAAGVTVVDHQLTDYLQYADGSKIAPGNTVTAYRIAPVLAGIVDADPLHKKTKRYWYGFTSDPGGDEWGVEGYWDIEPDTGPIDRCSSRSNYSVQVGGSVQVGVFFPGTQGLPGTSNGENDFLTVAEAESQTYAGSTLVSVDETGMTYQYFPDSEETVDGVNVLAVANPTGRLISTSKVLQAAVGLNTEKRTYPAADESKLSAIEEAATVDQTAAEIESAYNTQVPQITPTEINDGTEQGLRTASPSNLKDMIAVHAGSWSDNPVFAELEVPEIRGGSTSGDDLNIHSNADEDGDVVIAGTVTVDEVNKSVAIGNSINMSGAVIAITGNGKVSTTSTLQIQTPQLLQLNAGVTGSTSARNFFSNFTGFGFITAPEAMVHAKGSTNDSSAYAFKAENSDGYNLISARNDRLVEVPGEIAAGSLAIDSAVTITAADSPYTVPPGITEINIDSTGGDVDVVTPAAALVPGLIYSMRHYVGGAGVVTIINTINGTANQSIMYGNVVSFKSVKIDNLYEFWRN